MATPFNDLPRRHHPYPSKNAPAWLGVIDPVLKYAGSPGDWGYESKLGVLTKSLHQIRAEIVRDDRASEV